MVIMEKAKNVITSKYVVTGAVVLGVSVVAVAALALGKKAGFSEGFRAGRMDMLDELEEMGILDLDDECPSCKDEDDD